MRNIFPLKFKEWKDRKKYSQKSVDGYFSKPQNLLPLEGAAQKKLVTDEDFEEEKKNEVEKNKKKWEKKSKKEKVDEKLRRKTKKSTLIRLGSLKVVFPGMGVVGCQFEPLVPPSYFKKNLSNIDITSYNWETIYLKYVKSEKMLTSSVIS